MRSHVTVIPEDRLVIVDGQALEIAFTAPEGLHALQWHQGAGHIEWSNGPNQALAAKDYDRQVQPFVEAYENELARLEEAARPMPEQAMLARIDEIDAAIRVLEQKGARPLLAIRAGLDESYDQERITELVTAIIDLRCERQRLEAEAGLL